MASLKASEEGKKQIESALKKKEWTKCENSQAIQEASRWIVLSYFREKEWTEKTQLNRRQLERCKLFDKNFIDKIFLAYTSTTSKKIESEIEELKVKGISYGTWNHFYRKLPIKTRAFKAYCEVLGLNWEEIKEDPPQSKLKKNIDTERLSCRESEVSNRNLALVEEYTKLFVGRDKMLELLDEFLIQSENRWKIITAKAGFGKTALLANWVKSRQKNDCFIAYHFFSQRDEITRSVVNAYRNLLQQLYNYCKLSKPLPDNKNELREALHDFVKDWKGKPLVVVIDGLDEADRPFLPPFYTPLPQNVFVIASARASEGEQPEYLSGWENDVEPIHLDRLPRCAIANWLQETGKGELVALAQDETFVTQVCDRTEGIPLFLKYLIDELLEVAQQGEESAIRKTLAATPKGFAEYIRQQYQALNRLEDWRSRPDMRKIFYFLTIAKGELSSYDLVELMGESPVGLPWQISRWFKIRQLEDCLVFSFAHSTLAEQFAVLPEIQANTKKSQKELIKYCAQWDKYKSPYALRHYAEHLRDVKHWEELYAIARNEDFYSHSIKQFPDEPDLPLKTVKTALLAAADQDKPGEMAEFMLLHAQQLLHTTAQDSPLEALRKGSLERAWKLADLYEIEYRILWYLLLAWELKDTGKFEEAEETLKRLQPQELPRLSTHGVKQWQSESAAYLLARIFEVSEDICTSLEQKLLDNCYRRFLSINLRNCGNLAAALKIMKSIRPESEQVLHLLKPKAKIEGDGESGALETVEEVEAMRTDFATVLISEQKPEASISFMRASALARVAEIQVKNAQKEVGATTARIACKIVQNIDNPAEKTNLLAGIVQILVEAEKIQEAIIICDRAYEIAQQISNNQEHQRSQSFGLIAQAQATVGEFDAAIRTIKVIPCPFYFYQADALRSLAQLQIVADSQQIKKFKSILSKVHEFYTSVDPLSFEVINGVELLTIIAVARSTVGETEAASATFDELLEAAKTQKQRERDRDLSTIAIGYRHLRKQSKPLCS